MVFSTEITIKFVFFRPQTVSIVLVAITFVIAIPLCVLIYYKRHKLHKTRKKYCNCFHFGVDKNGAEVEDANREFSCSELQTKPSSIGNIYDNNGSDWSSVDAKKWEIPRSQIRTLDRIGEGCFGTVWKGVVDNIPNSDGEGPTVVAIKTLKTNATDKDRKDLLNELAVMKTLDPHPNVVRLLGCCTEKGKVYISLENLLVTIFLKSFSA